MLAVVKESQSPDLMCSHEFVGMCADYLLAVLQEPSTTDSLIREAAQRLDSAVRTLSCAAAPERSLWGTVAAVLGS